MLTLLVHSYNTASKQQPCDDEPSVCHDEFATEFNGLHGLQQDKFVTERQRVTTTMQVQDSAARLLATLTASHSPARTYIANGPGLSLLLQLLRAQACSSTALGNISLCIGDVAREADLLPALRELDAVAPLLGGTPVCFWAGASVISTLAGRGTLAGHCLCAHNRHQQHQVLLHILA